MNFWTRSTIVAGVIALLAGVIGGWMALSTAKSPVEKDKFIVTDTHGAGKYMVVRQGNDYLQLKCLGGYTETNDGQIQHLDDEDCYEFKPGETITLERWDKGDVYGVAFVYKMHEAKGEYDYLGIDNQ